MKRLVLFTASFPYGSAETFLEDEIKYLCASFNDIIIIPLSGHGTQIRDIPNTCTILSPIIENKWKKICLGLFNIKTAWPFLIDFWRHSVLFSRRKLKAWLATYFNTNLLLNSKAVKSILNKLTNEDVIYFYWGVGANCLSIFYRGQVKLVSRFHGEWDLWEESSGGYAVLREQIIKSLDAQVFISEIGRDYLCSLYPCSNPIVCRLGTLDHGIGKKSNDGVLRIVSCSTIYPLKRVHLIFEALNNYTKCMIVWTHLGGGPDFELLSENIKCKTGSHLKVNLLGQISHPAVLEYYSNNKVDMFINLSTNEGVPVSIMEAISFDIPVVATNVGGTREVVNDETGILISANPSIKEIDEAIDSLQKAIKHPRKIWMKKYDADKNYREFAGILHAI